jgi:hypothetical protein
MVSRTTNCAQVEATFRNCPTSLLHFGIGSQFLKLGEAPNVSLPIKIVDDDTNTIRG